MEWPARYRVVDFYCRLPAGHDGPHQPRLPLVRTELAAIAARVYERERIEAGALAYAQAVAPAFVPVIEQGIAITQAMRVDIRTLLAEVERLHALERETAQQTRAIGDAHARTLD